MAVQMEAEVEVEEVVRPNLRLIPPEDMRPERHVEVPQQPAPPRRPVFPAREVMAIIEVLMKALSLRLLLTIGFGALAYLAYLTISEPTPTKIVALGVFAVLGYLPLVALTNRRG